MSLIAKRDEWRMIPQVCALCQIFTFEALNYDDTVSSYNNNSTLIQVISRFKLQTYNEMVYVKL